MNIEPFKLQILLPPFAVITALVMESASTWKTMCLGTCSKAQSLLYPMQSLPIIIDQHGNSMNLTSSSLLGLSRNILKTLAQLSVHHMTFFHGFSEICLCAPNIPLSHIPLTLPQSSNEISEWENEWAEKILKVICDYQLLWPSKPRKV